MPGDGPPVGAAGAGVGAVEVLRRSEARYRPLVEASAADVWVTTPDGWLLTDLPRWRATTRQSAAEVVGDGWLQAVHPHDRDRVAEVWRCATAGTGVYEVEYRIVPVRGPVDPDDVRTLSVRGVPVRDASGQALEHVGVTVDVTERGAGRTCARSWPTWRRRPRSAPCGCSGSPRR